MYTSVKYQTLTNRPIHKTETGSENESPMIQENKTILQCIKTHAENTPHKMAIADVNTSLSYREYWKKIQQAAVFLKDIGTQKGEYVLIKASQSVEFLALCHAVQLAGGICVPLEKSVNKGRVQEILRETGGKKLFGEVEGCVCHSIQEAFCHKATSADFAMPNEQEEAMVLFTTGTTGKSKGIVISYSAEFAVAENVRFGVAMKADNVEMIPMPMNHSFSLRRYFSNMLNGSSVVLIDGVFFVKILFEMMEKHKVTALAMAPAAMNIIVKLTKDKLTQYAGQLDYIQFGSAPLPEADKEHLLRLMPHLRLYNIYGSTEMGCACILNFNSEDNHPHCIGYPAKNAVFTIVDERGKPMEHASAENPGYLSYTGSMGMKSYFNDAALTKETMVAGYLQSNDLGYKDAQGRIYMLGRADDIIVSGGNKISPLEVEEAAKKYPGVLDCICKGKEDALLGAVPVLYLVAHENLDIAKLAKHLANLLEDFKRPRSIQRIEKVPRMYNDKIDRKVDVAVLKKEKKHERANH